MLEVQLLCQWNMYIITEKKIPTKKMDKISDLIKFKIKHFTL
jgi:hypothetical protein